MAFIKVVTTWEDVKAAAPETIWYGFNTCWWTHRNSDLRTKDNGLPCDPRGGMLLMCDAADFFAQAEANPAHYGKHGLDALVAAHNDNCVVSFRDFRQTCLEHWTEYNELLDLQSWDGEAKDA